MAVGFSPFGAIWAWRPSRNQLPPNQMLAFLKAVLTLSMPFITFAEETQDSPQAQALVDAERDAEATVNRARTGQGPTLIECKTYRWRGHTERPGQENPRPKEEIEEWRQRDPINRFATSLMEHGLLTEEAWQKMDDEILEAIEDAVKFSEESPFPEPEAAVEDILAE